MAKRGLLNPQYLTDIADAIREKNGSEETYTPPQMATAIQAISTGAPDGKAWTEIAMPYSTFRGIACNGRGFLAAAASGNRYVASSPDGVNWTAYATLPWNAYLTLHPVLGGFLGFSCPYHGRAILYTEDGSEWTQVGNLPTQVTWYTMGSSVNQYVIFRGDTVIANAVACSSDLENWTYAALPVQGYIDAVCEGNGRYVAAVRAQGYMFYSDDGMNWIKADVPSNTWWSSVAWGNGVFVMTSSSKVDYALYSYDGATWYQTAMPREANWQALCYGNGKFVAMDYGTDDGGAYSVDGIHWTEFPAGRLNGITWGKGVFAGYRGTGAIGAYSRTTNDYETEAE